MAGLVAPRARAPRKGPHALYVEFSEDLFLDLSAFCKVHYKAPQIEVIREALREHIDDRINSNPSLRERFIRVRDELKKQIAEPLRLIDKGKPSDESDEPQD